MADELNTNKYRACSPFLGEPGDKVVVEMCDVIDALRAERDELLKKQDAWLMSPEAAQRLEGYRELSMKAMKAEDEATALRAEVAALKAELNLWKNGGLHGTQQKD